MRELVILVIHLLVTFAKLLRPGGVPILLRGGWMWPLFGAAFCAATLGAFLWSVEWGLFGYHERLHGTWQGRAAVVERNDTRGG